MAETGSLWQKQLAQWAHLGAPLKPHPDDLAHHEAVIQEWATRHGGPRALLLGVTPEIARLRWPAGTHLVACDLSVPMLQHVWPGFPGPGKGAICASWLQLPLAHASRDLVVADGSFNLFPYPERCLLLLDAARQLLAIGGFVLLRVFCRPEAGETPAAVLADLQAGRIGNFHIFKFRLAMSLVRSTAEGVKLADVWECWHKQGPRPEELTARLGWSAPIVGTIEAYQGQQTRYYFPTRAEFAGLMRERFEDVESWLPPYEMGDRCPTFIATPKP